MLVSFCEVFGLCDCEDVYGLVGCYIIVWCVGNGCVFLAMAICFCMVYHVETDGVCAVYCMETDRVYVVYCVFVKVNIGLLLIT